MNKYIYILTGLTKIFTSRREAFRQAKSLAEATQASIMVYKVKPPSKEWKAIEVKP